MRAYGATIFESLDGMILRRRWGRGVCETTCHDFAQSTFTLPMPAVVEHS